MHRPNDPDDLPGVPDAAAHASRVPPRVRAGDGAGARGKRLRADVRGLRRRARAREPHARRGPAVRLVPLEGVGPGPAAAQGRGLLAARGGW